MSNQKKPAYGGQAVMEGVMFGGRRHTVTAIRRKDQSIEYFHLPRKTNQSFQKMKKIPFLRGIIALIEASANGTQHLNFSSERYDVLPEDDEKVKQEQKTSKLEMIFGIAAIGVLSFLFGKFVFTLIPVFLAASLSFVVSGHIGQVFLESVFKIILLLGYIYFISLTPLIKRVFQYHGAEHKVINTFEKGLPLTVENVQSQSRLHYRCGSSFILFTVIVGMFVYLLVPSDPLYARILNRIALIPVVLGISFEVLQLTNKVRSVPVLKFLGYPGLWLQLLTTKEPKNDQVEVAIASFNRMMELEKESESGLKKAALV
ncbi:DUF1385 domain-containing protein [Jeotgalibacillus proteolyticus]|uniref:DUF1385 domain-containing protein n=1 Tax=Jeotgalibacillus proteolyticus TaxID=2082395 RepID=A0A2S5GEP6_9BACL|nr:DUF1385 domain-containing protein [Jeotgalibacillus proteolyticus]PPA71385.1 DUF1385 domain-containing protein [Jeotgalibacillus proteolyticus]